MASIPELDRLARYEREYRWAVRNPVTFVGQGFLGAVRDYIASPGSTEPVDQWARGVREEMRETLGLMVLSRRDVERYDFDRPMLVLSIVDPHRLTQDAAIREGHWKIVRFRFHDLDPQQWEGAEEPLPKDIVRKCMSAKQADEVVSAVEEWLVFAKGQPEILVHCEAGISRSAGVAAALSWLYNGDDEHWHKVKLPNAHVKRQVIEAWTRRGPSIMEAK